jgi:predicted phage baseplate assembly protein
MAISRDPSLKDLNNCNCCQGVSQETPVLSHNRPGLDEIAYRVGTHARFLQSMMARLSGARHPALGKLKTRDTDDPTIALLDACAAVDDVLTFYQERYGQENYLRTARERVSLVQLARLIGYEPRPGVAAGSHLAFTIEDTPGSPEKVYIEPGVRVQSVPGPGELPQTFETTRRIEARSVWNSMKLRTRQPHPLTTAINVITAKGMETGIKRGDSLLIVVSADATTGRAVKRVTSVTPDPATLTTRIEIDAPPPPPAPFTFSVAPFLFSVVRLSLTNSVLTNTFAGRLFNQSDVSAFSAINNWSSLQYMVAANTPRRRALSPAPAPAAEVEPPPDPGIFALRQRAAIFGHNAPAWRSLPQVVNGLNRLVTGPNMTPAELATAQHPDNWDTLNVPESAKAGAGAVAVDLDNSYPAMIKDSWLVLESPTVSPKPYRIKDNRELTRNDFAISGKVTRLRLYSDTGLNTFRMRETTALGQSEKLALSDVPVNDPFASEFVVLDKFYPGLAPGQTIILTGQRTDLSGVTSSEGRRLKEVQVDGTLEATTTGRLFTRLVFEQPLEFSYVPETVTINANVAPATHGESVSEVLGGGDARRQYQTFTLKQMPLTYTSARTPTGAESSLEVRVNDLLWKEVPTLSERVPDERVYITRIEDDGKARVQFNARLPTGQENVKARYRKGIGLAGLVHADQLTLLAVRPLGVRGVTNPVAPSGAEEPESRDAVRRNAPLGVLTLDRLVSLRDYEDFARAFAGFAKARATLTVAGGRQGVFLTVAGANGAEVSESSEEYANLTAALRKFGDPNVSPAVRSYRRTFFQIEAKISVDPAYLPEKVVEAVRAALRQKFSFAERDFAQSVTRSEVIATIQNVPGVVFTDLDYLFRTNPVGGGSEVKTLENRLVAAAPQPGGSSTQAAPAELLTLDPRPVQIGVVTT